MNKHKTNTSIKDTNERRFLLLVDVTSESSVCCLLLKKMQIWSKFRSFKRSFVILVEKESTFSLSDLCSI